MLSQNHEIVVIGAGAAGTAAAIAAARGGCRTLLVERWSYPGGIAVRGNLTTLCGLYCTGSDSSPEFAYLGLPLELAGKLMKADGVTEPLKMGRLYVLPFRPESFRRCIERWIGEQEGLDVLFDVRLADVSLSGDRVEQLLLVRADEQISVKVGAVIDCSGDAAVSRMAGLPVVEGDESEQIPALMLPMVAASGGSFSTARRVEILVRVQRAVASGLLPESLQSISFLPSLDPNRAALKWNLAHLELQSDEESETEKVVERLAAFLRAEADVDLDSAQLGSACPILHRTGGRLDGKYRLTGEDVLSARSFPEAGTVGCWPVEKWDGEGKQHLQYLPDGKRFDIPAGSLQSAHLQNLFAAGKCLSADEDAAAATRVIGCCLATGEAAGKMAAAHVANFSQNRLPG